MTGRILIVDDTLVGRMNTKSALQPTRYVITQAVDADSALRAALAERPDLIVLAQHLPGGGTALCAQLKSLPELAAIPVLLIDDTPDKAARFAAFASGADEYLPRDFDPMIFSAVVRSLMRSHAAVDELVRRQGTYAELGLPEPARHGNATPNVHLIAPDPQQSIRWRAALGLKLGPNLTTISAEEALAGYTDETAPDAFVIGTDLPEPGAGLRLISELRSRPATRNAVIITIDPTETARNLPMALDLGANAVLSGSFSGEEIALRLAQLIAKKQQTDALRASVESRLNLAVRDPLTGLYNRRYANAYLDRLAREADQTGAPFTVMLLDLDRFKNVNDTYGHAVGDEVLTETADRLRRNLRDVDLLARFGGEEFVIAMPGTDMRTAKIVAERLRSLPTSRHDRFNLHIYFMDYRAEP